MFEVNIALSFLDLTLQNNFLKDNSENNGKVTESEDILLWNPMKV